MGAEDPIKDSLRVAFSGSVDEGEEGATSLRRPLAEESFGGGDAVTEALRNSFSSWFSGSDADRSEPRASRTLREAGSPSDRFGGAPRSDRARLQERGELREDSQRDGRSSASRPHGGRVIPGRRDLVGGSPRLREKRSLRKAMWEGSMTQRGLAALASDRGRRSVEELWHSLDEEKRAQLDAAFTAVAARINEARRSSQQQHPLREDRPQGAPWSRGEKAVYSHIDAATGTTITQRCQVVGQVALGLLQVKWLEDGPLGSKGSIARVKDMNLSEIGDDSPESTTVHESTATVAVGAHLAFQSREAPALETKRLVKDVVPAGLVAGEEVEILAWLTPELAQVRTPRGEIQYLSVNLMQD